MGEGATVCPFTPCTELPPASGLAMVWHWSGRPGQADTGPSATYNHTPRASVLYGGQRTHTTTHSSSLSLTPEDLRSLVSRFPKVQHTWCWSHL